MSTSVTTSVNTSVSTSASVKVVRKAPDVDAVAAAARQARFGHLPERVGFADMVEEQVAPRDPARDAYNAAGSFISYSCLALDLGL